MEEEPDASESDADESAPSLEPSPARLVPDRTAALSPARASARLRPISTLRPVARSSDPRRLALAATHGPGACAPTAWSVSAESGRLLYGSDMEGGGPYAYPEPDAPRGLTGFEVELMRPPGPATSASSRSSRRGSGTSCSRCWTRAGSTPVINGYEWTEQRARDYLATRPYYVYQLQLMVRRGSPVRSWADLKRPRPGGGPWTVGVLVGSAADTFAAEQGGPNVRVVRFDGATDAMTAVQNGQYDATLQDLPGGAVLRRAVPGPRAGRRRPSRTGIT